MRAVEESAEAVVVKIAVERRKERRAEGPERTDLVPLDEKDREKIETEEMRPTRPQFRRQRGAADVDSSAKPPCGFPSSIGVG